MRLDPCPMLKLRVPKREPSLQDAPPKVRSRPWKCREEKEVVKGKMMCVTMGVVYYELATGDPKWAVRLLRVG